MDSNGLFPFADGFPFCVSNGYRITMVNSATMGPFCREAGTVCMLSFSCDACSMFMISNEYLVTCRHYRALHSLYANSKNRNKILIGHGTKAG